MQKSEVIKPHFLFKLIVFSLHHEICLWMCTNRANFRCFFTNMNVTTVRTNPHHIAISREYNVLVSVCFSLIEPFDLTAVLFPEKIFPIFVIRIREHISCEMLIKPLPEKSGFFFRDRFTDHDFVIHFVPPVLYSEG